MVTQYIVDIISNVVASTDNKLTADGIDIKGTLHYEYGSLDEINEVLHEMSQDMTYSARKYPLIALFTDIPETKGVEGIESEVKLKVVIAMRTDPKLRTRGRMTNIFKPILIPIYHEFLNQLFLCRNFFILEPWLIPHTKTDCFSTGRQGTIDESTKLFNDYVDCIYISDLNLKLKQIVCETLTNNL